MIKLFICLFGLIVVFFYFYYRDVIFNGYVVFNLCGVLYWEVVGYYDFNYYIIDKNLFVQVEDFLIISNILYI